MDTVERLQVLKKTVCWLHPVPSNLSEDPITFLLLPQLIPNPLFMMNVLEQIFVQQEVRL